MPVKVRQLGHVALNVADVQRSVAFYSGVLGLRRVAEYRGSYPLKITFLSAGNHHEVALIEAAPSSPEKDGRLAHLAFQVGTSLDELRQAKEVVRDAGIEITTSYDHVVTPAIFLSDPDGNQIELYVDISDAWRDDPQLVAEDGSGPLPF